MNQECLRCKRRDECIWNAIYHPDLPIFCINFKYIEMLAEEYNEAHQDYIYSLIENGELT